MESFFPILTPNALLLASLIALLAGLVKGVIGFGLPLVFISGLTMFLPAEIAVAALILPTLATNIMQTFGQGIVPARQSIRDYRVFLIVGAVSLVIAAQFVRSLPEAAMVLIIGVPVTFFAILNLSGYRFRLRLRTAASDAIVGSFTGALGGLSGIWAPPTVAYLTALDTPKTDQIRIQGVIYGLGALVLVAAHLGSGVLRSETIWLSAAMIPPGMAGMWVGGKVMHRIDQQMFRNVTLLVLLLAGLNLIRRGLL